MEGGLEALKTCNEHEKSELSFFCKTCRTFICITCGEITHQSHTWDLIASVAKERRSETPKLCRKIKEENIRKYREKLDRIDKAIEQSRLEDIARLEERRTFFLDLMNRLIDEQKRQRDDLAKEISDIMKRNNKGFEKKLEDLEQMTTVLESNIGEFSDYDFIQMEQDMLTVFREVELYNVGLAPLAVKFEPGEINHRLILEMIGRIEETATSNVDDNVRVEEVKAFDEFEGTIWTISPISETEAWASDDSANIKLLSVQEGKAKDWMLNACADFIILSDGDFITTHYNNQVVRRFTSCSKEVDIVSKKPLHPNRISKTQTDDVLVTLMDDGDLYRLQSSSRRLVQRMTLSGKVIHTYEFLEDGATRLFTFPRVTTENGNSDICVINETEDERGELITLHRDGRVRFTYNGQYPGFNPIGVACDSHSRIIISDFTNNSLHLLDPDGTLLGYLHLSLFDYPRAITLYQNNLWVGFYSGQVKVYKYIESHAQSAEYSVTEDDIKQEP